MYTFPAVKRFIFIVIKFFVFTEKKAEDKESITAKGLNK